MDNDTVVKVEHLGHLGLVAGIFERYGITQKVTELLPKTSNNQKISHAQAIQCLIYQGLGFSTKRMYSAERFFSGTPICDLLGEGVEASHLNDDVLGKALDAIHRYGASQFFTDVAFSVLVENGLMSKFYHMDSTTHSLFGRKYDKSGRLKVCYGHSKGRADLPQLIQLLMTTDLGLPFWSKSYSGNANDREIFQKSIVSVQTYFKKAGINDTTVVADSALYSKQFLLNKEIDGYWITRVPESIQMARKEVEVDHKKASWIKINKDLKYRSVSVKYGGVKQRWIIVNNRESRYKELATLEKNLKKEEAAIERKTDLLMKKIFRTKEALNIEFKRLQKAHPLFSIRNQTIGHYAKKKKKERRPKRIGFQFCIGFERNSKRVKALENKKGKFIVATNHLGNAHSAEDIIDIYGGRNRNIEGCFKLIKDSSFRLNEVFLKRLDRIEALMSVMALSLFVNNLGQMTLRGSLKERKKSIPNQSGKPTDTPTLKWAFQLMDKAVKVKVTATKQLSEYYSGLGDAQKTIIDSFGETAQRIYGFP